MTGTPRDDLARFLPHDLQAAAAEYTVRRGGSSGDGLFTRNHHAKDAEIEQSKGNQHGLKPQRDPHGESFP